MRMARNSLLTFGGLLVLMLPSLASAGQVQPEDTKPVALDPEVIAVLERLATIAAKTPRDTRRVAASNEMRQLILYHRRGRKVVEQLVLARARAAAKKADLLRYVEVSLVIKQLYWRHPDAKLAKEDDFDRAALLRDLKGCLESDDPRMQLGVAAILRFICAQEAPPHYDFRLFEPALRNESPPLAVIDYMCQVSPRDALLSLGKVSAWKPGAAARLTQATGAVDDYLRRKRGEPRASRTVRVAKAAEILSGLARHPEWYVRMYVAAQIRARFVVHTVDPSILQELARDDDPRVRRIAALAMPTHASNALRRGPGTPPQTPASNAPVED